MTPFTESILNGIRQNDQEAFTAAEESAMAFAFGTGANVGLLEEYLTLLRENPPKTEDIEAIKNALVSYLTSDTQNDYASSAVFAL
jgi:hypothetical protein